MCVADSARLSVGRGYDAAMTTPMRDRIVVALLTVLLFLGLFVAGVAAVVVLIAALGVELGLAGVALVAMVGFVIWGTRR